MWVEAAGQAEEDRPFGDMDIGSSGSAAQPDKYSRTNLHLWGHKVSPSCTCALWDGAFALQNCIFLLGE